MDFDWYEFLQGIVNWITTTGIKIVVGSIVVLILFKLINRLSKRIETKMNNNPKIDRTVASFVEPVIRKGLKILIFICFIGYIGIETSSIAAAIASAGLGIGLALQGALSNLAGGFIILCMRPFKVGDYISVCGESGTVESIQIFYTTLVTIDNKVIMVPNGKVADDSITNVSTKPTRRVDMIFSISYENDIDKAKRIIKTCVDTVGLTLPNSEVFINIVKHNSSSIDISTRVWVKNEDYWILYFRLLEDVKTAFDENGIEMSYSKVDVNLKNMNV